MSHVEVVTAGGRNSRRLWTSSTDSAAKTAD